MCFLAKMTFNMSHLGMCIVTRQHFITTERENKGTKGEGAAAPFCPRL